MISEAGTNAGEDKLERKMVASGASVTCRIHSYTTYEEAILHAELWKVQGAYDSGDWQSATRDIHQWNRSVAVLA